MNLPSRNDLCPCGSGKKYKKCCLGKAATKQNILDQTAKSRGADFNTTNVRTPSESLLKAVAMHQAGQLDDAKAAYQALLKENPNDSDALHYLGMIAFQQSDYLNAASLIGQAIKLNGNVPAFHFNLGNAYKQLEQFDFAINAYLEAIRLDPQFSQAHLNLGNTFRDQGDPDAAAEIYRKALSLKPDSVDALINLGLLLEKQGRREEAQKQFERCLELDHEDRCGARFMLASLGVGKMPERASDALLAKIYKERAKTWDQSKSSDRPYRGAELVVGKLRQSITDLEKLDILDAGCGTGLVGELLHDLAIQIDGIDMSEFMLQRAEAKGIYKRLFQGDLVSFMSERPGNYDIVTCAATLIHFGDLQKVFEAAAVTLRDNGLFIFTLFQNEKTGEDVVIGSIEDGYASGGCYAHSKNYITRSATSADFIVEQLDTDIHEYQGGKPIMGLIVVLRRQFRNKST